MSGSDPLVIALDSSTTATKAVVVDKNGEVLASGKADIKLLTPKMDHYEHDPFQWWESTHTAISQACDELSEEDRGRIRAIGITHQRETFALLDDDGEAIRPAILWLDSRAGEEIKEYGSEEIHELSGKPADTTPAIYKMAWLKKHEPEVLEKAAHVVDVHAYLSHRLTGKWVSAVGSADTLNLFDISKLDYSPELMEIAGVTREQMADLADPCEIIGTVKEELLSEWGLPNDVVLVAGVGDGQAAGLGTAAIGTDVAYVNAGTSVVAGVHSDEYKFGREYRTLAAGIPGYFIFEIVQNSGSVLANWFRENLGDPALEGALDERLDEAVAEIPPGSDGLLTVPYWNAVQSPYWNPFAKGIIAGFGSAHTRAHVYRSIVEGIAMELKINLAGVQAGTGRTLKELRCTGGGMRNPTWRQIFADVTGLPIVRSTVEEVPAQGAAMMAMTAIGAFDSVEEAAEAMSSFAETTEPDMERHKLYAQWADVREKIYPQMEAIMDEIREVAKAQDTDKSLSKND